MLLFPLGCHYNYPPVLKIFLFKPNKIANRKGISSYKTKKTEP